MVCDPDALLYSTVPLQVADAGKGAVVVFCVVSSPKPVTDVSVPLIALDPISSTLEAFRVNAPFIVMADAVFVPLVLELIRLA